MKKLFSSILIISILLFNLHAESINECKTDIYFGNGVWNNKKTANIGVKKLNEIINNNPNLEAKYSKVKLQYNWGNGHISDVLEMYYQLKEAGQINDFWFIVLYGLKENTH